MGAVGKRRIPGAGRLWRRFATAALIGVSTVALAQESAPETACHPLAEVKQSFVDAGVELRWIDLTEGQFHFLQGVYFENPLTPPGLPRGTSAILGEAQDGNAATAFFMDGRKACSYIIMNKDQLASLMQVETGRPPEHAGDPL